MKPRVLIVCGSAKDLSLLKGAEGFLKEMGVEYALHVASAHRTPELVRQIAKDAERNGIEVIMAAAGWAAHLPGVIASYTTLPVIGVPLDTSPLRGVDSVLSILQMPRGIPVATVAVGEGGATNGAILATEILALKDGQLKRRLKAWRRRLANDSSKAKPSR